MGLFYFGGYMPIKEEQKEEALEEKKEEELKEVIKEEEKELTPDEIFEQSFGELTDNPEEKEEKQEEEKEESSTEEEKTSTEEETIEDSTKTEVKSEEKTQQETSHKEEPPAKAPPKEKAKEEKQEERQERTTEEQKDFDPNILFEGLENDVADPELKKELAEFADSMDTNAKYAQTIAKIVGKRIVDYTNQSFKTLIDKLTPYLEATVKQIEKEHASSVRERHQDFDDLKENEDVEVWIKEQPKYLQKAMLETFKKGESKDVVDLLDSYKKDRGLIKPAKEEEEDPVKANNKKKIRDKIDNLSVVKTKASPVHLAQKATNQDDFEGAFDEIASSKR
jgi:hypothetical protein